MSSAHLHPEHSLDATGLTGVPNAMLWDLAEGTEADKLNAIHRLMLYGPDAIGYLCCALTDQYLDVRIAAADALGEIGDRRAIESLQLAIREHSITASVRRMGRWAIWAVLITLAALIGLPVLGLLDLPLILFGFVVYFCAVQAFAPSIFLFRNREHELRERSLLLALLRALREVANRSPSPESAAISGVLRSLARSSVARELVGSAALQDARLTAEQLDASAARAQSLPIPHGEAVAAVTWRDLEDMPRPADPATNPPEALPRFSNGESSK